MTAGAVLLATLAAEGALYALHALRQRAAERPGYFERTGHQAARIAQRMDREHAAEVRRA